MPDDSFNQFFILVFGILLVENAEFSFFDPHASKAIICRKHALIAVREAVNTLVT